MRFEGLTYDDILLRPEKGILTNRIEADISSSSLQKKVPIYSAPMPSIASVELIKEMRRLGGEGVVHRINRSPEEALFDYRMSGVNPAVAIGIDYYGFDVLYKNGVLVFVLDVAHGHSERAIDFVKYVKSVGPCFVIAGSVATYQGAMELAEAGADALRVGVGPGAACTTRQVTGFGVPQLQAIEECSQAGVPVIADGGIKNSGDIAKAIAAGADAVMIGSLFAHALEAPNHGTYYGCASGRVNNHHAPEGIELEIEREPEPLEHIIKRLTWGLRSAISYAGGSCLEDLRDCDFTILSAGSRKESKL